MDDFNYIWTLFVLFLPQEGDFLVRTHHVEYDGGILDPDDILSDLVEDKDKVRPKKEEKHLDLSPPSLLPHIVLCLLNNEPSPFDLYPLISHAL